MSESYIGGSDIGGTWVRVAISKTDLKEGEIRIKKAPTSKENKLSLSNQICDLFEELLEENGLEKNQLRGIGLASAGPLDLESGIVFNNANLGFKEIPLKEPIIERFPELPFYLINDCIAAVLGIHFFEADESEKDNLVYITMSTGIGGGVICDGLLLLGKDGNAAEIGHALVEPKSDYKCNCGAYGCWEVFSSGTGAKKLALEGLEKKRKQADILRSLVNGDHSKISAKEIFEAAKKGDELSQSVVDDIIFYSKVGVGIVNNFYDSKAIYFGGAMMNDKDQIIPPIKKQFETNPIRFTINHPPKIKVTKNIETIGLKGALVLVKYLIEKNPVVNSYKFI